jgi:peroxiredoxin
LGYNILKGEIAWRTSSNFLRKLWTFQEILFRLDWEAPMRKWAILLAVIWMEAFLIPLAEAQSPRSEQGDYPSCASFGVQRLLVKEKAPPFSLKTADGNEISLNDLEGRPALLIFWASWCGSCKEEIPVFDRCFFVKRSQLTILTVAIDGESEKRIQRFVKKHQITLPVLLDRRERVARSYGVRMVPTVFLIDGEGFIVGKIVGERDWSLPEAWLAAKELLYLR